MIWKNSYPYLPADSQRADYSWPAVRVTEPHKTLLEQRAVLFKKIKRHSYLVSFLRFCLPFLGLSVVVIVLLTTRFVSQFNSLPNFDKGTLSFNGNTIVMSNPKLSGFGNSGQHYEVSAQTATQSITNLQKINLGGLFATITLADGTWAHVRSATGAYDTRNALLTLQEVIELDSSDGYTITLQNADIDLKANILRSYSPIEVTSNMGFLQANELTVDQSGKRIRFTNGVRLIIAPPQSGGALIVDRP